MCGSLFRGNAGWWRRQLLRLHEFDAGAVAAAELADAELFERRFAELLEFVPSGELLGDAHLGRSDATLPRPCRSRRPPASSAQTA